MVGDAARRAAQPFDFLTWFDHAPQHAQAFEEMVGQLRATEEWRAILRAG